MVINDDSFSWEEAVKSAMQALDEENFADAYQNEKIHSCDYCNFKTCVRKEIEAHNIDVHTSVIYSDLSCSSKDLSINYERVQDSQEDDLSTQYTDIGIVSLNNELKNNFERKKQGHSTKKNKEHTRKAMTRDVNCEVSVDLRRNETDIDPFDRYIDLESSLERLFYCLKANCKTVFGTMELLLDHIYYQHKMVSSLICPCCEKEVKYYHNLIRHIKQFHVKTTRYTCKLCGFFVFEKNQMNEHLKIYHRINVDPTKRHSGNENIYEIQNQSQPQMFPNNLDDTRVNDTVIQTFYKCKSPSCNYFAYEPVIINQHYEMQHRSTNKNSKYKCNCCYSEFSSKKETKLHFSKFRRNAIGLFKPHVQQQNNVKKKDRKTFDCKMCKGRFVSRSFLTLHKSSFHSKFSAKRTNSSYILRKKLATNKSQRNSFKDKQKGLNQNLSLNDSHKISEYEKIRQRNVENNKKALLNLGLIENK